MPRKSQNQVEAELQDPASWDAGRGFEQTGNPSRRAVVSVPFGREDFSAVAQAARREGMRTSEFIREAAIEKARGPRRRARITNVAGGQGLIIYADATGLNPIAANPGGRVQAVSTFGPRIRINEELAATM